MRASGASARLITRRTRIASSTPTSRRRFAAGSVSAIVAMLLVLLLAAPESAIASTTAKRFTVAPTPSITGARTVGQSLTVKVGRWSPSPSSWTYRWRRDGVGISGATGARYRLAAKDAGARVSVDVTAHRTGYTARTRTSARTASIVRPFTSAPTPGIDGVPVEGRTMTLASSTAWAPTPSRSVYRWFADGKVIPGASDSSLLVDSSMVGSRLSASVEAERTGYANTTRMASATAPVRAPVVVSVPGGALSGTWTPDAADEYRISADVSIPKGSTLTLQPGTHVIVDAGVTMKVNGTLSVAGSSAAPVTLGSSSASPKSGDWQGLLIGDGAALSMQHTVLSDTAQAISTTVRRTAGVVVSDSSVLRSSGGLLIRAGALTLERSTIDGGVSVRRGDGPAASSDAITIDEDTVSAGPIDVVSRNSSPAAVPVVVRDDVVTGVGSPRLIPTTTTVVTTYPIEIEDDELRPSDVVGNRMSQNELNGIALGGVLVENWTIPTGGPQYVVWAESAAGGWLEVQSGVTLTVPAGATLKVSDGTTLEVLGDLQVIGTAGKEAVITVAEDDTAGSTVGYFGPPAAGAWAGLVPHFGGTLELRFARIDYATTTVDAYRSSVTIVDSQLLHARWPSRFDQGSLTLHRSTVDGGVTAHRPASSVLPDAQIDIEDDVITDGPLTVLSENAEPQSAPIVVERNVVQNVVAPAWAMPTYPIQIWDEALRPSHLTGTPCPVQASRHSPSAGRSSKTGRLRKTHGTTCCPRRTGPSRTSATRPTRRRLPTRRSGSLQERPSTSRQAPSSRSSVTRAPTTWSTSSSTERLPPMGLLTTRRS